MPGRTSVAFFGLFTGLAACSGDTGRELTAPDGEAVSIDAEAAARSSAGNTWTTRQSTLPPARYAAVAAAVNKQIYLVGGDRGSGDSRALANVERYSLATNSWTSLQPLPGGRADPHGATFLGTKLYVSGGSRQRADGTYTGSRVLFIYDFESDSWSKGADMPEGGGGGVQGGIGGRLYVYRATFTPADDFYRYNPSTNQWVSLPSPPIQHIHGAGGVINGRFYLVGGEGGPGLHAHAELSVYNPNTNSWTTKAPMSTRRRDAAAAVLNGKLYVAGGITDAFDPLASLEVYDPATDTWATKASMSTTRSHAAGTAAGGRLFVIGGEADAEITTTVEAYTP